MTFRKQSMQEILYILKEVLDKNDTATFNVLNPDLGGGYAGSFVTLDNIDYMYRGYKSWSDLAELLFCKMLTPEKSVEKNCVRLVYKKLSIDSFHGDSSSTEKYGLNSKFNDINKMEEPAFLYYYMQALENAKIKNKKSVLNLGINTGEELEIIKNSIDKKTYNTMEFRGVDHSRTAINFARKKFQEKNVQLYVEDINNIDLLNLGKFDLLISIGTLQSPSIHFKPFFMHLVQNYLVHNSAIILGFPNSRWVGGEMIYGAKAPNYKMSEMSLLYNDVIFCKKYLQQKKYRVTLTGKQYVFLTATKIV